MTVTDVVRDPQSRTLTLTTHFDAPPERVWQVWADPRLLERWWGPPAFPATVVDHDLTPGGTVTYFMTSPEGEKYHGYWRLESVDAPKGLSFEDGFADAEGQPSSSMPTTRTRVTLAGDESVGTTMTLVSTFATVEAMEQLEGMGMVEGITSSLEQIPALLAA